MAKTIVYGRIPWRAPKNFSNYLFATPFMFVYSKGEGASETFQHFPCFTFSTAFAAGKVLISSHLRAISRAIFSLLCG